ncbi:MAG TPA: hypothetical protein VMW25_03470 [Clostridia bacterium]|nr:hypothetical protein [Clostridia bacterium]
MSLNIFCLAFFFACATLKVRAAELSTTLLPKLKAFLSLSGNVFAFINCGWPFFTLARLTKTLKPCFETGGAILPPIPEIKGIIKGGGGEGVTIGAGVSIAPPLLKIGFVLGVVNEINFVKGVVF